MEYNIAQAVALKYVIGRLQIILIISLGDELEIYIDLLYSNHILIGQNKISTLYNYGTKH